MEKTEVIMTLAKETKGTYVYENKMFRMISHKKGQHELIWEVNNPTTMTMISGNYIGWTMTKK